MISDDNIWYDKGYNYSLFLFEPGLRGARGARSRGPLIFVGPSLSVKYRVLMRLK